MRKVCQCMFYMTSLEQQSNQKHWYALHVIGICAIQICLPYCTYMFHCIATVVHPYNKKIHLLFIILMLYVWQQHICPSNAICMSHSQLFNTQIRGKYANIYVTYHVAAISSVDTKCYTQTTQMTTQPDGIGCIWPFGQISQNVRSWFRKKLSTYWSITAWIYKIIHRMIFSLLADFRT